MLRLFKQIILLVCGLHYHQHALAASPVSDPKICKLVQLAAMDLGLSPPDGTITDLGPSCGLAENPDIIIMPSGNLKGDHYGLCQ